jgi:DNA-binding protein H-NS
MSSARVGSYNRSHRAYCALLKGIGMPTYEAITAQIEKLRVKAETQRQKELGTHIKRIQRDMEQHGITVEDLGGPTLSKWTAKQRAGSAGAKATTSKLNGVKAKPAPKYRDPDSGNTWSGQGRAPTWIRDAADRDVFLIGKGSAAKSPAKKSAAAEKKAAVKPASKRAGQKLNLSPKYQDPQTGNTWTGHGKAPGWIRDVANRDDFLIGKARAPKTQTPKVAKAEKKTAKKAAVKKSAPRKVAATQEPVEAAAQE